MTAQDIASNGRTAPGSMPAAAGELAQPAGQSSRQTEAPVVLTEAERADRRRAKKQRQKAARAAPAAAQEPKPTQAQHVEVTSATVVAPAMEPLTAMQRLCMRASLRRRHMAARKQLPKGETDVKCAAPQQHSRGVIRYLHNDKSLQRCSITSIRPGKGNVDARPKIKLITTTGLPAGASSFSHKVLSLCSASIENASMTCCMCQCAHHMPHLWPNLSHI